MTDSCPDYTSVPASRFSFDQLASIYNESRIDYIVPMPMNAKRMEAYIRQYDVNLDASIVALNADDQIAGVGMLGLRPDRAWITRLGVIPSRRGRGIGQFMMDTLLSVAQTYRARAVQLEVIDGNEPAYGLFIKHGFRETRRLLVIRRPPGKTGALSLDCDIAPMTRAEITAALVSPHRRSSWIDEAPSVLQGDPVEGLRIQLDDGRTGWIVFCHTPYILSHVVWGAAESVSADMVFALLTAMHTRYPKRDAKIENLDVEHPAAFWDIYQHVGYRETFARIEMMKQF